MIVITIFSPLVLFNLDLIGGIIASKELESQKQLFFAYLYSLNLIYYKLD